MAGRRRARATNPQPPTEEEGGDVRSDEETDEADEDEDEAEGNFAPAQNQRELDEAAEAEAAAAGLKAARRKPKKPKGAYIALTRIKVDKDTFILPGDGCDFPPAEAKHLLKLKAIALNL